MTIAHLATRRFDLLAAGFLICALGAVGCGDDDHGTPADGGGGTDGSVRTDGSSRADGAPAPDGALPGMLCSEECPYSGDDECDDGGPDSLDGLCDFGTDCMDCGPRDPADCVPSCDGVECGDDGCGGSCGSCAAGSMCGTFGECVVCGCDSIGCGMDACGTMDCGSCTDPAVCYRSQCRTAMCMGRECGNDGAGGVCGTMDGDCPDMQWCVAGSCTSCACGTHQCGYDCDDNPCGANDGDCPTGQTCDNVTGMCLAKPDPACNNTCFTAGDGECDDGRPGSHYSLCELGTDCADCGPVPAT